MTTVWVYLIKKTTELSINESINENKTVWLKVNQRHDDELGRYVYKSQNDSLTVNIVNAHEWFY